ncbi:MAG: hypothetical protein LLF97_13120, partial [Planctomycetaceae bacterium]|nr:hypothetical protein [Planctomycetaceae bacterium]
LVDLNPLYHTDFRALRNHGISKKRNGPTASPSCANAPAKPASPAKKRENPESDHCGKKF